MFRKHALAVVVASLGTVAQAATLEELATQVQAQQAQIEALTAAVEKAPAGKTAADALSRTTLGGYGEAHFYGFENAKDQYDAYRFVLYVGHQFSDKVRLQSELEVEHGLVADTDVKTCTVSGATATCNTSPKPGELELEQMFIEWDYFGQQKLSVGQILVPVGFLNETHEPDTFYGAKRNPVESNIIPTTWWEGGIKASGEIAPGLSYDAFVSTGLTGVTSSSAAIRNGRQKGAKAVAEDLAYTTRLRYTGVAGLDVGVAWQRQTDMAQGALAGKDIRGDLLEAHIGYAHGPLSLRTLWAKWNITGLSTGAKDAEQEGFYVEAGYKVVEKLGLFVRNSQWDNAADDTTHSKKKQWNYGANFWLTPRTVFKLDFQEQEDRTVAAGSPEEDGFALGVGYSF
ncbi:MAG: porin [Pseudomonadota bacterium]